MPKLKFHADGTFRILQVSDAQDMHFVRHAMPYMLRRAYTRLKPDLIVFTGDNILGNHLCDRRFGSGTCRLTEQEEYARMKKALSFILDPPESAEISFAMIFGNHDDRNRIGKAHQLDIFRSYTQYTEGESAVLGNFMLPIYDADGAEKVYTLWLFDSARYDAQNDRCEESILPETAAWFAENSDNTPSIAFIHIPLPITKSLLCESEFGVAAPDGKRYALDPTHSRGILTEYPSMLHDDGGLFDALCRNGQVKALVFGHDHQNNFVGRVGNTDIIQSSCASFRCYGNRRLRGVRVIDLDLNTSKTYSTCFFSYEDLCGDGVVSRLRYFYNADEYERQKNAVIGGLVGCAVSVGGYFIGKRLAHRKPR